MRPLPLVHASPRSPPLPPPPPRRPLTPPRAARCSYGRGAAPAGVPVPLAPAGEAQIFGTSNGIPPTSGISLINNAAPGGPRDDRTSTPDQNLAGALCLRSLAIGRDAATGA